MMMIAEDMETEPVNWAAFDAKSFKNVDEG